MLFIKINTLSDTRIHHKYRRLKTERLCNSIFSARFSKFVTPFFPKDRLNQKVHGGLFGWHSLLHFPENLEFKITLKSTNLVFKGLKF